MDNSECCGNGVAGKIVFGKDDLSACAKVLGKPLLVRSPHTATAPIVEL
jgi:hypothetical protein